MVNIMGTLIQYVAKKELFPAFGKANKVLDIVYIRSDLPKIVQEFVKDHELYHIQDDSKWWVEAEIKANFNAALKHPIGFIVCVLMSMAPDRIKFYWNRFRTGDTK